ncbi:DUF6226 family protein [Actinoplanes sp. NPDC049668]|uniref:DUF6226 family protein n=1 Tax=unclassified Actinoplanes TaxID=2626549 RepID=UPI0033A29EFD
MGQARPRPNRYTTRVTDPGRYHVVQEAAEALLDELTEGYVVGRREGKEPVGTEADAEIARTIRLIPRSPAAGPLSIALTEFPGVVLRLGRWFYEPLPECGCDDCDEDPEELVTALRRLVAAHVEGGLWERVRRGLSRSWLETRLIGPGLKVSRRAPIDSAEARAARREGFAAPVRWEPWPRRGPRTHPL